jgi:hypothetical protein
VVNGADYACELWSDNGTNLPQSEQFSQPEDDRAVLSWSLTEAVGVTLSHEAGVPTVAKTSASITVKLNVSSTQTTTTSDTQTWQVSSPIVVPPQKSVKVDMIINTASYQVNFAADTSGYTLGPQGLMATARGTFTGGQGLSVGIITKEYPLPSTAAPKDFKALATHTIPSPAPLAGVAAAV